MMDYLDEIVNACGISSAEAVHNVQCGLRVVLVLIIALMAYWIVKKWVMRMIVHVVGKTETQWDDLMFDSRFFNYLALFFMPLSIRLSLRFIGCEYGGVLHKFVNIWGTVALIMLFSAVLDGANRIYDSYPVSKNRPIKVFVQVLKVFLYFVALLVIISDLINRDPMNLLMGLSAFAAVLMLVFKDMILGFVAGVQLIANRMVNIGDWIVMPSANADGEVLEINLTTVKVQNWDKTISTIPTYKMVSESFINWRGMEESGGRRIKRFVNIDLLSVRYLQPKDLEELKQSALLKDYVTRKIDQLKTDSAYQASDLDGPHLTNIGIFREYMNAWLDSNPDIAHGMTHMVRQLQPGPTGLPLEVYCFSARKSWMDYERVQADLFDHLYAVLPLFGLRVFQYRSDK